MNLINCKPLTYRADIDGLRAIAVLSVLFFHADIGFSGGFVGVDVFFVISGYLITRLILKDLIGDQFRILEFWERRVRRILPALMAVVLSSLTLGWLLFLPADFKRLGGSVVAQAILASNVKFWLESGYFEQAAELKPLLHTWSLAVEEQFYLIFPFLLMAIQRFSRTSIVRVILLLFCVSFALSIYWSYRYAEANFYLLPTRAWELLIGSFFAAIPLRREPMRWLVELLGWGGLIAILCALFFYDRETRFPGVAAVLPCGGAALIIWANSYSRTSSGRVLAARPLVFIGLISYSLYLWHWPMLVFSKYLTLGPIPLSQRMFLLLASMVLACLSWKFVEIPFRKNLILKSRFQVFSFASIATSISLLIGLAIYQLQGVPSRVPAEALEYVNQSNNENVLDPKKNLTLTDVISEKFTELGNGDKNLPIDLFVWGDSHAMAATPVLDSLCKAHAIRGFAAEHLGTLPLINYESTPPGSLKKESIAFNSAVLKFIQKKHVSNVLIIARWDIYITEDRGTDRIHSSLFATIKALREAGSQVWIMRQVPKFDWNVPIALALAVKGGRKVEELGLPLSEHQMEYSRQNPIFEGLSTQFSGVVILDPTDLFLDASAHCLVVQDHKALYSDKDHLTTTGAMRLRPLLQPIFESIIQRQSDPVR